MKTLLKTPLLLIGATVLFIFGFYQGWHMKIAHSYAERNEHQLRCTHSEKFWRYLGEDEYGEKLCFQENKDTRKISRAMLLVPQATPLDVIYSRVSR